MLDTMVLARPGHAAPVVAVVAAAHLRPGLVAAVRRRLPTTPTTMATLPTTTAMANCGYHQL